MDSKPNTRHMRVVRTIVIEGPEDWVKNTLKRCYVKPGPYGAVEFPDGARIAETLREIEIIERTTYVDPGAAAPHVGGF